MWRTGSSGQNISAHNELGTGASIIDNCGSHPKELLPALMRAIAKRLQQTATVDSIESTNTRRSQLAKSYCFNIISSIVECPTFDTCDRHFLTQGIAQSVGIRTNNDPAHTTRIEPCSFSFLYHGGHEELLNAQDLKAQEHV